jgi:hypothetical protein
MIYLFVFKMFLLVHTDYVIDSTQYEQKKRAMQGDRLTLTRAGCACGAPQRAIPKGWPNILLGDNW